VTLSVSEKIDNAEMAHMREIFGEAHEKAYGHKMTDPIELVSLRFSARGEVEAPELPVLSKQANRVATPTGTRQVYVGDGKRAAYSLYERDALTFGDTIEGPAIISEHTATTVFHAGDRAELGKYGEIIIHVAKAN
jgi:N-methylhydantoinase A